MRKNDSIDSLAAWPAEIIPPRGVLVLSGYGLDVRVWRGRLRAADGIGKDRREVLVHRATGRLHRLVVLGHTGTTSLEAIRWLADVGAGYVQIDADGRVLAAFGPLGTDRPSLRRAQACALDTPLGNGIVRRLLAEKIAGQAEALVDVDRLVSTDESVVDVIRRAAASLHLGVTRDALRLAEATAANAYWSAWASIPVRFGRRDAPRLPGHWLMVGPRSSPLTGGPRLAATPAQALLNLAYGLLLGEATIAARIVGLDPGLGLLHADQPNRDSLGADLVEPCRPLVDRYVLRLLTERTFAADDFYETRQGVCRVTPPLARELALASRDWAPAVGRVAEDVARLLVASEGQPLPTPLTGRRRSAGRGSHGKGPRPERISRPARGCAWCGTRIVDGRVTCSAACEEAVRADDLPRFVEAGTRALAGRHATGQRTELSEAGRARVARRSSDNVRAAREWQRTHAWPIDIDMFAREIGPRLGSVALSDLVAATGLSRAYLRRVVRGDVVPHPMWWDAIVEIADARGSS